MELTKFTLILGPMFSGKSYDLIGYLKPFEIAKIPFGFYQPKKNKRDKHIQSRAGSWLEAEKIESLAMVLERDLKVVGVDEIHMFPEEDAEIVSKLLKRGTIVYISGLDVDYQGKMIPLTQALLELGPAHVIYKRAVCEKCRVPDAVFTQMFDNKTGNLVLEGLPLPIPEPPEGEPQPYKYVPMCRRCFIKKDDLPISSEKPPAD